MFAVCPVITLWQSILSTLLDDAYAFAFLCHLNGSGLEIHTVMNPHILNLLMELGFAACPNLVTYVLYICIDLFWLEINYSRKSKLCALAA